MDNKQNSPTKTTPCPECDTPINLPPQIVLGKIIECPACSTESEITSCEPLQLAPLEEEK